MTLNLPPTSTEPRERLKVGVLASAMIANSLAVMPIMVLGALAVFVRAELDFSEVELGLAVSIFFAFSAALSVQGGRIAERLSPARSMLSGVLGSCVSLVGIATLARSWSSLVFFLVIGGLSNAISLPGANLTLARAVPVGRRGLAFGLKQASVPVATTIAGLMVPVIGLTIGWRWAFGLISLFVLPFLVALRSVPPVTPPPRGRLPRPDVTNATLIVLAVAAGFAVAVGSSLSTFYVESAVSQGFRPEVAGVMLAGGGVAGAAGRILWGLLADRWGGGALRIIAGVLVLGSLGAVGFSFAGGVFLLGLSTLLAFAFGWGWNGLFHFAVVHHNPSAPAVASGITMMGMRSGGIVGPFLFGFIVNSAGYRTAWLMSAISLVLSAVLFLTARWLIRTGRGRTQANEIGESRARLG